MGAEVWQGNCGANYLLITPTGGNFIGNSRRSK